MSDSNLTLKSQIVNYGAATLAGAAVGSLVPSATTFVKKGLKDVQAVDRFVASTKAFKDGAKSRLSNAWHALVDLKADTKPSALREFYRSGRNLVKAGYDWCANLAKPITSRPMAKWAVIGAAVAAAGYFAYNKIFNKAE